MKSLLWARTALVLPTIATVFFLAGNAEANVKYKDRKSIKAGKQNQWLLSPDNEKCRRVRVKVTPTKRGTYKQEFTCRLSHETSDGQRDYGLETGIEGDCALSETTSSEGVWITAAWLKVGVPDALIGGVDIEVTIEAEFEQCTK
jgi:hypothetical protein